MNSFLHIQAAFKDSDARNLETLASCYTDRPYLKALIQQVMQPALKELVIKDKQVLLKPNWVTHDRKSGDALCMRTHSEFVLAALEVVLEMGPASVLIGDAPIQGCKWDKMILPDFEAEVDRLGSLFQTAVSIKDFRRVTFDPSQNNLTQARNPLSEYVITDLGKDSFLEPITRGDRQIFRVTDYNPDRFTESHAPGVHKYCITKSLYDADVVISLPKVKTHQKAGITAALKNIVGLNGDKDFLPHHRLGGTGYGGDCYPGNNPLRYGAERALDFANRHQGKWLYWIGQKTASLLWRLSFPGREHHLAAGWHGNDTTWRMVLDLNRIITHGLPDGTVSRSQQRVLYSLTDGIIGGQGDGPLDPLPLPLGVVAFTNDGALHDGAMAILMGFDPNQIPMLRTALAKISPDTLVQYNGIATPLQSLSKMAIDTIPPPGWISQLGQP